MSLADVRSIQTSVLLMAEVAGFEPVKALRLYTLSKRAP